VHDAAAWVTVSVWPAMVRVPTRTLVVLFGATVMLTTPVPEPLAPAVTVIQAALLTAVHAQPLEAVTVIGPLTPASGADSAVVDSA